MHTKQVDEMKQEGRNLSRALGFAPDSLGPPMAQVEATRAYLMKLKPLLATVAQEERQRPMVVPASAEEAQALAQADQRHAAAHPVSAAQIDLSNPIQAKDSFVKIVDQAGKKVDQVLQSLTAIEQGITKSIADAQTARSEIEARQELAPLVHGRSALDRLRHGAVKEDALDLVMNTEKLTVVQALTKMNKSQQATQQIAQGVHPEKVEVLPLTEDRVRNWVDKVNELPAERRAAVHKDVQDKAQWQSQTDRIFTTVYANTAGLAESLAGSGGIDQLGEQRGAHETQSPKLMHDLHTIADHLAHLDKREQIHAEFEQARQQNAAQVETPPQKQQLFDAASRKIRGGDLADGYQVRENDKLELVGQVRHNDQQFTYIREDGARARSLTAVDHGGHPERFPERAQVHLTQGEDNAMHVAHSKPAPPQLQTAQRQPVNQTIKH